MELPELIEEHLGDEDVQAGLALGDDDLVCLTPTRTLLYRADGLLSDERVTEYPHDLERLELSEGRRKAKLRFEYVGGDRTLTVPADAIRNTLALVLEGVLGAGRILDDDEGIVEAFRFSELTLVVADNQVIKHVGNSVWDGVYESFAYKDLTGVDFEQARVATEVVLYVDGRPERIKTPNDDARTVERALERALTEHFDVTSLSELQSHFQSAAEADEGTDPAAERVDDAYSLDSELRPLGENPESRTEHETKSGGNDTTTGTTDTLDGGTEDVATTGSGTATEAIPDAESASMNSPETPPSERKPSDPSETETTETDMERIDERLAELTAAVNKQNELLRNHHTAIQQLVSELRSDD